LEKEGKIITTRGIRIWSHPSFNPGEQRLTQVVERTKHVAVLVV